MATIINADTSDGLKLTSDTSGQIDLQSAGSTKARVSSAGLAVLDGADVSMSSAAAGQLKVDGSGYSFAVALDASAAHLYHNSASRDLVLGINETEQMKLTRTGDLKFNSGFGSVGTAYGVRAWVNFDGSGTISINASGGVSSLTDIANAAYRVNFATAMPDTNFTMCISTRVHGYDRTQINARTTTSCEVGTFTVGGSGTEYDPVNVIFVR
jgi:hypothetical protein